MFKFVVYVNMFVCTGLTPPLNVRAGVVTDRRIEVLWDKAKGHGHLYEVLCIYCTDTVMVCSSCSFIYAWA